MRRLLAPLIALALVLTVPAAAHAQKVIRVKGPTKAEALARWKSIQPFSKPPLELVPPSLARPFSAGKLSDRAIADAVNVTNFVRYLAGVPDATYADPLLCEYAQHGAHACAMQGKIGHWPARTAGYDDAFWEKARIGAESSNLDEGSETPWQSVWNYMEDHGIDTLGHRKAVLQPRMTELGFGFVLRKHIRYNAMFVRGGNERTEPFEWDIVAWPPPGAFPLEYFNIRELVWSVDINPNKYLLSRANLHLVKVRIDKITGRGEDESAVMSPLSDGSPDDDGNYFAAQLNRDVKFSLAFKPARMLKPRQGDRFRVTITGLYTKDRKRVTLEYEFEAFALGAKE